MAETAFLRECPELERFVLRVRWTNKDIGGGSNEQAVKEVIIPDGRICAAKLFSVKGVHNQPGIVRSQNKSQSLSEKLKIMCELMSTLSHPNIVFFFGVAFPPDYSLLLAPKPALIMERLLMNLHHFLQETDPIHPKTKTDPSSSLKPFFPLIVKCLILLDVARGLAYLHEQSPPVIHRDLSARNILLGSDMVAKIADLGMACRLSNLKDVVRMTAYPGESQYMPPEARNTESAYDGSIDIFAFGVLAIFTIGEMFPSDPLQSTYYEKEQLIARTELERRSEYMRYVNEKLHAYGQFREDHPLIRLIQQCLHNLPAKRPGIREVLRLLEEAKAGFGDKGSGGNKREMTNQRILNLENEISVLKSSLNTKERELADALQQLRQKEAELTRAEETIKRGQQLIQEMKPRETELVQATDSEIAQQMRGKNSKTEENIETPTSTNLSPSDFVHFPKPTLATLVEVIGVKVHAQWKFIGRKLELEEHDLDEIQKNNNNDVKECMTKVFSKWHDGETSVYSWKTLAEALCSRMVGLQGLLQEMHADLTALNKPEK